MENEKPIGLVINDLRKQKRLSAVEIGDRLGITKQSVYETFKNRKSMSIQDLEKWSQALEVNVQTLIDMSTGKKVSMSKPDLAASNDETLNSIRKMLEDELREKNEQIRALQEALRQAQLMSSVLLGKSREYSDLEVMPLLGQGSPSEKEVMPLWGPLSFVAKA